MSIHVCSTLYSHSCASVLYCMFCDYVSRTVVTPVLVFTTVLQFDSSNTNCKHFSVTRVYVICALESVLFGWNHQSIDVLTYMHACSALSVM